MPERQPVPVPMIKQTVGELLTDQAPMGSEGIDRLYLNPYQPRLQTEAGAATFFKHRRGAKVASTPLMGPMSRAFGRSIQVFDRPLRRQIGGIVRDLCQQQGIELVEDHAMPDHIHLCLSISPKCSVANTIGFLKQMQLQGL